MRRLRSFGVTRAFLQTSYNTRVASAVCYTIVRWGSTVKDTDRAKPDILVRRVGSVPGRLLGSIQEVADRRMLVKLASIMGNTSHCEAAPSAQDWCTLSARRSSTTDHSRLHPSDCATLKKVSHLSSVHVAFYFLLQTEIQFLIKSTLGSLLLLYLFQFPHLTIK